MKYVNLYYKDNKLNNRPLSEEEANKIMENNYVYKRNEYSKKMLKIPSSKIIKINTIII